MTCHAARRLAAPAEPLCVQCGRPIPLPRQREMPITRVCAECEQTARETGEVFMPVPDGPYEAEECDANWWSLLDNEVLDCLGCGRPLTPEEIGDKLGMSADAAASLLTIVVHDGRVRITSVAVVPRG